MPELQDTIAGHLVMDGLRQLEPCAVKVARTVLRGGV
jgi:hypothetical protein